MFQKIALKITLILVVINVNSAGAQVKPSAAADRLAGLQKRKVLNEDTTLKSVKYRNIGPSNMSGRVVDIDVNPYNPIEFYVAYATGGLWYTKNNGQSLKPVFDKENSMGIGDIAVNWKKNIIWVGTGEANSSRSSYSGDGIYISKDSGKTWQHAGLAQSQHIGKIQLHPADDNKAWVAVIGNLYSSSAERGVYKTADAGKTWNRVLTIDENTGAIDMDINPQNPEEIYAATWYRTRRAWNFEEAGRTSAIYKSMDGGTTWRLASGSGSGFPGGDSIGRIGLAVCAKNPSVVYAVLDNQGHRPDTAQKKPDTMYVLKDFKNISKEQFLKLDTNKLDTFLMDNDVPQKYSARRLLKMVEKDSVKPGLLYDYLFDANAALFLTPIIGCELYRSDNAGASWRKVNTKAIESFNTYGYYFGKVSVAPDDENKVAINGFDLQLSTDGGKTFKRTDKISTHPDWHACWINPANNNHWVAGNDGGCNVTYDNGEHWFKANTPSVGQFYAVTTDDAKPYNVYGGLQDNGVWYAPVTSSESDHWNYEDPYPWKNLGGGDGMQVQVDTRDNKTVYSGLQFGYYNRRVIDVKGRPLGIRPQPDLGEEKFRFNWQTPILLSRHNQDVFYYGSNYFHRSLNKGENLQKLSYDLSNGKKEGDVPYGTITSISESPLKFGLLYAGTDDGNVHISKDGGYTWTLISKKLPQQLWISRVRASQHKEGRVYVTLNGYRFDHFAPYIFVSEDYGQTWQQLGGNLPNEPINVVTEDNVNADIIYIGTDKGIYTSFSCGKVFMNMSHQLPNVPVHDLVIQKRENELVVATHGRSIYVAKLAEVHKKFRELNQ
ncbi:MAG: hypothetical protein WAT19_00075 [Ferruginibacter sp.]